MPKLKMLLVLSRGMTNTFLKVKIRNEISNIDAIYLYFTYCKILINVYCMCHDQR